MDYSVLAEEFVDICLNERRDEAIIAITDRIMKDIVRPLERDHNKKRQRDD